MALLVPANRCRLWDFLASEGLLAWAISYNKSPLSPSLCRYLSFSLMYVCVFCFSGQPWPTQLGWNVDVPFISSWLSCSSHLNAVFRLRTKGSPSSLTPPYPQEAGEPPCRHWDLRLMIIAPYLLNMVLWRCLRPFKFPNWNPLKQPAQLPSERVHFSTGLCNTYLSYAPLMFHTGFVKSPGKGPWFSSSLFLP